MNKELEAFNYLYTHYNKDCFSEGAYEILKSALERKEKLEKALKIIKDKINVELTCEYNYTDLTETEFNLLKEMLE